MLFLPFSGKTNLRAGPTPNILIVGLIDSKETSESRYLPNQQEKDSACRKASSDSSVSQLASQILQLSHPQRCVLYGRFPAANIFHHDQIPLPFALTDKRTLSGIGEPVFVRLPKGSGLDKRQASIQLCFRAAQPQIVRIAIICVGWANL